MRKSWFFILIFFTMEVYAHHHTLASTTYNCPTIADVYIDELVPYENLNYKTRILISYHPSKGTARGLFKFDIPANLEASQIDTATLYLSSSYHTGGGYAIDIHCYALNVPFDEQSDTWNTLSGGDYDPSVVSPGALPANNDWETSIDVTDLITGNLDKVRDNGLLMRLQQEGVVKDYQNIASRESTDHEDFAAYLEIECSDSTSSTTTSQILVTTTSIISVTSTSSTIKPKTTTTSTQPPPPPTTSTTVLSLSSTTTTTVIQDTSTVITSSTTSTIITPLCPVETIYGDNSEEAEILKYVRDYILNTTPEGKEIIVLYYEWSPYLVECIENNVELKNEIQKIIDELLQIIQ